MKKETLQNKRFFQRKTHIADIYLLNEFGQRFLTLKSSDLSLSGIFLKTNLPLKNKTKLFIEFVLNSSDTIKCTAEVVRLVSPQRGPGRTRLIKRFSGMGLRFLSLNPEQIFLLEQFFQNR